MSEKEEKLVETESSELALDANHQQFLLSRHGRLDLDPLPDINDENPLNWLPLVKMIQLSLVTFHAFSATFMAAGVIPAFGIISEKCGTSIDVASYLTSCQIIVMGIFPFLWVPLMNEYGRRQILVLSTFGSMAFNIGCLFSQLYASLMVCRLCSAFFMSPAMTIGGLTVSDITFSHQRGSRNGWWALMISLGTHCGPFLMGFVEYQINPEGKALRWVFGVFAIMNAVQFLCYLVLGRETVYDSAVWYPGINKLWKITKKSNKCKSINSSPPWEVFLSPLSCIWDINILVPTIAYSVCFSYANVALGVELTKLYFGKFGFNEQQIGYQFLGLIIGSLVGEFSSGWTSDVWMHPAAFPFFSFGCKLNRRPSESRLWISYIGFSCVIIGLLVYGFILQRDEHWTVVPNIGMAIAASGLQMVSSISIAFAIDTNPRLASDISLFVTLVRQVLGFVGPFYFPPMIDNPRLGIRGCYGILASIVFALGFIPTILIHIRENVHSSVHKK